MTTEEKSFWFFLAYSFTKNFCHIRMLPKIVKTTWKCNLVPWHAFSLLVKPNFLINREMAIILCSINFHVYPTIFLTLTSNEPWCLHTDPQYFWHLMLATSSNFHVNQTIIANLFPYASLPVTSCRHMTREIYTRVCASKQVHLIEEKTIV